MPARQFGGRARTHAAGVLAACTDHPFVLPLPRPPLQHLLPEIAAPGDDHNYGSSAMNDVTVLQVGWLVGRRWVGGGRSPGRRLH